MNIKQEETAGYAKNIFMFEYPKRSLSGIDYGQYSKSPPCTINNLMWRILITKKKAEEISKDPKAKDSLGVYLECLGKSKLWSCFALVRFILVSQKPDVSKNLSLEFKHLFSAVSVSQGYHTFITWEKLSDPEHGYIINDMIRIQVYVEADFSKNTSTLDYNLPQPQSFDDWLSVFETKLNDKIVRRVSEEIRTVNDRMRGFGKLSEEIKSLNVKMERVHNRGIKLMSEFLTKCLKVIIASFYSKMDALKLEDFHTEMASVVGELRRIKSAESEDQANEKSRNENETNCGSDSASEPGTEAAEETPAQGAIKEETETDCEIMEEKVPETITISSESDDDEGSSKNAPCNDTEENEFAPKPAVTVEETAISALDFFNVYDVIARTVTGSCPCTPKTRPKCYELSSQMHSSCSHSKVEPKCSKRRLENNCDCSSASTDPPKKSKRLEKDAFKVASDDSGGDSSSSCSCSSKSSQSSLIEEENV